MNSSSSVTRTVLVSSTYLLSKVSANNYRMLVARNRYGPCRPPFPHLCHHCARGRALVPPCWRQHTNSLVVSAQAVNSRFDQNQPELAVLILAVTLQVLAHGYGFLDQHVEIFGDFGCETCRFVTLSVFGSKCGDRCRGCVEYGVVGSNPLSCAGVVSGVNVRTIAFEDSEDFVACDVY